MGKATRESCNKHTVTGKTIRRSFIRSLDGRKCRIGNVCSVRKMVRVLQETLLNDHLLKKYYPLQSSIQRSWHPLLRIETWHNEAARKKYSEMKWESLNTSVPSPRFQSRRAMLNHTGGTYSHNGVMDYPRIPFSKWNLGKFPDSVECQSWKVNFRTEVCLRTADPQISMLWTTYPLAPRLGLCWRPWGYKINLGGSLMNLWKPNIGPHQLDV